MRDWLRGLTLVVLLQLCACSGSGVPDQVPAAAPLLLPLAVRDGVLRDAQGREVILRGLNHIALRSDGRRPAYRVDGAVTPPELLFDLQDVEDEDFARIAAFGYNFIRPVFTWEFAQPDPPPAPYNETYFRLIDAFLDKAAAHGLYVVFDFGQFGWSRAAGGNAGAPPWALSDTCLALPGRLASEPPQASARVACAFQEFWQNEPVAGVGLQDAYIALWREVMRRYRDHPAVVMVDLFNEPYGGLIPPLLLETAYLYPFYRRLAGAIREIDPDIVVGFQPELYHSLGIPLPATQAIGIDNAIFLPHNYSAAYFIQRVTPTYLPGQDAITRADLMLTVEDARTLGTPLLIGETGWTRTTAVDGVEGPVPASDPEAPPQFGRSLVRLSDELKLGWAWFAYSSVDPAYGIIVDGAVDAPLMRSIATPFPRAVSGRIDGFSFDADSRRFELRASPSGSAPAQIALPLQWQYPEGACISIDGRSVATLRSGGYMEQDPAAPRLRYDSRRALLELASTPPALTITPLSADCLFQANSPRQSR
ncbi:MAG TPA: cellulase family glycosylhydrolase [Solimonas sp.]|nr:cellulase family glycosylhydrolase [Solimonas sp.]